MDQEMKAKVNEYLKAHGRRELSTEEAGAVAGGSPDTIVFGESSIPRMEFLQYVEDIRQAYGNDVAYNFLLEGINSMNYYQYSDTHIKELYAAYGPTEGFWAMMDREGF